MVITDRAGRWVTEQVGRSARSVAEVAVELGCDWHTVNDVVISYGEALIAEPGRFESVAALGLDEVLFVRRGSYRHCASMSGSSRSHSSDTPRDP